MGSRIVEHTQWNLTSDIVCPPLAEALVRANVGTERAVEVA